MLPCDLCCSLPKPEASFSVPDTAFQEGHWESGPPPEEGHKSDEGIGNHPRTGVALERTRRTGPEKEKCQGIYRIPGLPSHLQSVFLWEVWTDSGTLGWQNSDYCHLVVVRRQTFHKRHQEAFWPWQGPAGGRTGWWGGAGNSRLGEQMPKGRITGTVSQELWPQELGPFAC